MLRRKRRWYTATEKSDYATIPNTLELSDASITFSTVSSTNFDIGALGIFIRESGTVSPLWREDVVNPLNFVNNLPFAVGEIEVGLATGMSPFDRNELASFTGDWTLNLTPTEVSPIPIPGAVWLFGTALIGLVGFSKRRKTA